MAKVEITVVKKLSWREIGCEQQRPEVGELEDYCELFREGEKFIVDEKEVDYVPHGFCSWAWHDIGREVASLLFGVNYPWMKKNGVLYSCCTDGLRPVIFKLERID